MGAAPGKRVRSRAPEPGVAKVSTRDRVLAACRALFNERGPAAVTTAEIAAAVGINEGNLYYHFQRKEQILEALFSDFAVRLEAVATAYEGAGDGGRYGPYLAGWFTLMWEWRFFYRDGGTIFRLAPALRPRLKTVSDAGQDHVRQALGGMRAAGLLHANPAETENLIVNAWIVSAYWIDYLRSRRGIGEIRREHLDWGAAQVASLFRPYLTEAGRAEAEFEEDAASSPPPSAGEGGPRVSEGRERGAPYPASSPPSPDLARGPPSLPKGGGKTRTVRANPS